MRSQGANTESETSSNAASTSSSSTATSPPATTEKLQPISPSQNSPQSACGSGFMSLRPSFAGAQFGVSFDSPHIHFKRIHDHIHEVIASIAPHDSVERFEGKRDIQQRRCDSSRAIQSAGTSLCCGHRFTCGITPVKGLADAKPLTNETVFDLTELPSHLIFLGGGPIGLEMAQSFRRLCAAVTILERLSILPRDEPKASEIARADVLRDGINLMENVEVTKVRSGGVRVDVVGLERKTVSGSSILVAAGRVPNTETLNLEAAGIAFGPWEDCRRL